MKQKLKLLFAFLRGLKVDYANTTISMDRRTIDDWGGKFEMVNRNDKRIKNLILPSNIEKIIDDLIEYYMDDFYRDLDLSYDDYWYLYVGIHPFQNKVTFESSHKVQQELPFEWDYEYKSLDVERQGVVDFLYSEFEDGTKIEFKGDGGWGDGNIYKLYVDGKQKTIDVNYEDALWNITNYFMSEMSGKYWNDGPGGDFDITIWGDDIFVKGINYEQEYENTGMLIEVTPDNFEKIDEK
tara:strand:- start:944 stop:1660 length:717 start_codon:yes stop_codon:yes gene_type:complete